MPRCHRDGLAGAVLSSTELLSRKSVNARAAHAALQPGDLNPIEQVFVKPKHLIGAADLRDVEATWRKLDELLDLFCTEDCANCLKTQAMFLYKNIMI